MNRHLLSTGLKVLCIVVSGCATMWALIASLEGVSLASNGRGNIGVNMHAAGPRGSFIAKKNIFLPPNERNKSIEDTGPSIEEDQFLQRYILYGTIRVGDYGVALLKVNPKKRRDVPKEIRDKKIIKLYPGESLEGYVLRSVRGESAIFDKNGKKIEIKTFDVDTKPERQTRISVAQATPKIRPHTVGPTIKPPAAASSRRVLPRSKERPRRENIVPAPIRNRQTARPPRSIRHPSPSSNTKRNASPPSAENNPFLRALKGATSNKASKSLPTFNPFLKMK